MQGAQGMQRGIESTVLGQVVALAHQLSFAFKDELLGLANPLSYPSSIRLKQSSHIGIVPRLRPVKRCRGSGLRTRFGMIARV